MSVYRLQPGVRRRRKPATSGGGGGGFAPTDIATNSLWLDGDDVATFTFGTGSAVSAWLDKSSNAYSLAQATSGSRPVRTATLNGRSGVTFDGTDDFLQKFSSPINAAANGAFTVFVVCTPTGSLTERSIVDGDDAPHVGDRVCQYLRFDGGQAQTITFNTSGGNTSMQGGAISAGTPYLLTAWCAGATGELFVNTVSVSTLTQTNQRYAANDTLTIGAQEGGTRQYFPGHIFEVVAYASALVSGDRTTVHSYLQTKWGL